MYNDIDSQSIHTDPARDEREADRVAEAVAFGRSNLHVEKQ